MCRRTEDNIKTDLQIFRKRILDQLILHAAKWEARLEL